jgi:hypothetical protein
MGGLRNLVCGSMATVVVIVLVCLPAYWGSMWHQFLGTTPDGELLYACGAGDQDKALQALAAGASLEARNILGQTPVALATAAGSKRLVVQLVSKGADPNSSDVAGYTPLMTATMTGDPEMVAMLLSLGAEVHAANARGDSARELAMNRSRILGDDPSRLILEQLERAMASGPPDAVGYVEHTTRR